jgi:uncharacterized damage-inducible protein DinB
MDASVLIDLYRLARAATDAGYYQTAKLLYAAAASLVNGQLYTESLPKTETGLAAGLDALLPQLSHAGLAPDLLKEIQRACAAVLAGRMDLIPPIFVCRACGHFAFDAAPDQCPHCGAGQLTFQYFAAAYYLEPEPIASTLTHLAATPAWLDGILAGVSAEQLTQKVSGAEGEWSLLEAAGHLLDSQHLIAHRVELFLDNDAPNLSAKAPREMIDLAGLAASAMAHAFHVSRTHMLDRLKAAPSVYWQRIGQHAEFGPVTLQQQVTYFAKHEHWHMAQITRIRKAVS